MKRTSSLSVLAVLIGAVAMLVLVSAVSAQGQRALRADRAAQPIGLSVAAAVPVTSTFTYQGQLKNGSGPVDGTCDMQFSLWDAPSGPNQIGSLQNVIGQTVSKGLFTIVLNSGNEFGATPFTGEARWLQVAVKCGLDVSYTTLDRQLLTAAPYASSLMPGAVISGSNNRILSVNTTNLTSGNAAIVGHVVITNPASFSAGVRGINDGVSNSGIGVYGSQNGSGLGVYGFAPTGAGVAGVSNSGYGVFGNASAASGTGMGVVGNSISAGGIGVYGTAPITGVMGASTDYASVGVFGVNRNPTSGYGVFGNSNGAYGIGVYGSNERNELNVGAGVSGYSIGGFGVFGFSITGTAIAGVSTNNGSYPGIPIGTGVSGYSNQADGVLGRSSMEGKSGVYGSNTNINGYGVYGTAPITGVTGIATDTYGLGVYGEVSGGAATAVRGTALSTSGNAAGVIGLSFAMTGTGVMGVVKNESGLNYGVYGETGSADGVGVYAMNDVITGTALAIQGAIRVPGAGITTTTPVFIHIATADNTSGYITCIDNAMTNGDASAILIVTQNWSPYGVYNAHPVGVYYDGSKWCIFNEDVLTNPPATMSFDAAFNVMVIKP